MTQQIKDHYKKLRDTFIYSYLVLFWCVVYLLYVNDVGLGSRLLMGIALFIIDVVGCYYWVKYKRLSYWLICMAIFGWIGWSALMLIQDKAIIKVES